MGQIEILILHTKNKNMVTVHTFYKILTQHILKHNI